MYEIKEVSIVPVALFSAAVSIVISIIPVIMMVGVLSGFSGGYDDSSQYLVWLIVPLVVGIISFVWTALVVWVYNMVADRIGGIEIELEHQQQEN